MAENKIIINKHFRDPSAITESVFSRQVSQNKYGLGKHEFFREGEIIVCNDVQKPGLYISVGGTEPNDSFDVINITSGEHAKLIGYHVPDTPADQIELSEDDTVSEAFGKVVKLIDDVRENSMPATGAGLEVVNKTLNVKVDDYTIKVDNNNRIYVDTSVVSGGGGGEVYRPGDYIAIDNTNTISVTGITPDSYATKEYVDEKSRMGIVGTMVTTATESFIIDGQTYEPGTYLVIISGTKGDETTYEYSYSNISPIINAGKEYLTEAQYETLIEEGEVEVDGRTIVFDSNVDYYTYED